MLLKQYRVSKKFSSLQEYPEAKLSLRMKELVLT